MEKPSMELAPRASSEPDSSPSLTPGAMTGRIDSALDSVSAGGTVAVDMGSMAAATSEEPTEPEKPKELTEKEKMAAALFGGVAGGGVEQSRQGDI